MSDTNSPWEPDEEIFYGKLIGTGGNWRGFAKDFYSEHGIFFDLYREKLFLAKNKVIDLQTGRELEKELSSIREFATSDDAKWFEHIFWGYYATSIKMEKMGDVALSFDLRGPRVKDFMPYVSTSLLTNGYTLQYQPYD